MMLAVAEEKLVEVRRWEQRVGTQDKAQTETSTKRTFKHACPQCAHVVAEHQYSFRCTDDQHVYRTGVMVAARLHAALIEIAGCDLCGDGELEQDILAGVE